MRPCTSVVQYVCGRTHPFGAPVVPDVYWMFDAVPGATSACGIAPVDGVKSNESSETTASRQVSAWIVRSNSAWLSSASARRACEWASRRVAS